ncbi:hypothetical protein H0R92_12920 [Treponema sp. OMZ 840]|uniref:hypothetical protein n=1 Tax=Treponema sp. OMZ 840 TaxID=244313 RepID=UPI003D929A6C
MLLAEYDYATDIAVQREEEREIALEEGEAIGLEKGFTQGARQKALETAAVMKSMNYPLGDIHKITGLSEAEIAEL